MVAVWAVMFARSWKVSDWACISHIFVHFPSLDKWADSNGEPVIIKSALVSPVYPETEDWRIRVRTNPDDLTLNFFGGIDLLLTVNALFLGGSVNLKYTCTVKISIVTTERELWSLPSHSLKPADQSRWNRRLTTLGLGTATAIMGVLWDRFKAKGS